MNISITENTSLAPYCSMKAGGNAEFLALPKTIEELIEAITYFKNKGIKYIVVGNCSNLLFPDSGFQGGVIITSGIRGISLENGLIKALCGETLSSLARFAWEHSLSGLEFCYGIPGTVGGGVYMNAGAYGGELSQRFVLGEFLTESGEIITLSAEEMEFGYRTSRLDHENLVLLSATFSAEEGEKDVIRAKMDELMTKRKSTQPLEFPSCGSA